MDCVLKLDRLPEKKPFIEGIRRAPRRDSVLSEHDMEIALKNALRYIPERFHEDPRPHLRLPLPSRRTAVGQADRLL